MAKKNATVSPQPPVQQNIAPDPPQQNVAPDPPQQNVAPEPGAACSHMFVGSADGVQCTACGLQLTTEEFRELLKADN